MNLKPTYVKVPVSTVERLKFYEDENVRQIVAQHLIEKETILAEQNAGRGAKLVYKTRCRPKRWQIFERRKMESIERCC